MVRANFCSGLICPRAQTCMDSKVVHADFGSRLICPRAQTCCAELRRLARLANSPGFKSFRCPRWRIKFSLERFSDSVAHLLEMGNQCRKTTLAAHFRGSTMQFCAKPQDLRKSTRVYRVVIGWRTRWRIKFTLERFSDPSDICLRIHPLKNSAGRVPQAADGTCNKIRSTGSCRSPRTV